MEIMSLKLLLKRHFAAPLKENETFFREKIMWIRRFGIRKNMSRASYTFILPSCQKGQNYCR